MHALLSYVVLVLNPYRYDELMSSLKLNEIIKLIPTSKLISRVNPDGNPVFDVPCVNSDDGETEELARLKTRNVLNSPLDYPALNQAVLPEDTVCIALEPGTPGGAGIVAAVIEDLLSIGVQAANVTVLMAEFTPDSECKSLREYLDQLGQANVLLETHNSTERSAVGYLSASRDGEPIVFSAQLAHSDFIIPIGIAKSGGWKSQVDFLYPYFSDRQSQIRFFKLNERNRIAFALEANRWLGSSFSILTVSPDSKRASEILAGKHESVMIAAKKSLDQWHNVQQWNCESNPPIADLVIAEVGQHLFCSITEVKTLIDAITDYCSAGGSCVVLWNAENKIDRLIDFDSGQESANAVEIPSGAIFVCTEQSVIRQLGYSSIKEIENIQRLIDQHSQCLILDNFQIHCSVTVSE